MDELITSSNICPADTSLFPLFVCDVSKQSEKLKSSVVDVQIRAIFNEAVPVGTQGRYLSETASLSVGRK